MIDERISIHDAFQLEIKQRLPFSPVGGSSGYSSETFLFVPSSLNINRDTFPKTHFYRSLKNYIRLQAPALPLERLLEEGGPLDKLAAAARALPTPYDRDSLTEAQRAQVRQHEKESKIFCLTFQRSLQTIAVTLKQDATLWEHEGGTRCLQCARAADEILTQTQRLGGAPADGDPPEHIPAVQEFCYAAAQYTIMDLLALMETRPASPTDQDAGAAHAALLDLARRISEQCKLRHPSAVPEESGDNVLFISHWNALKKYINAPLFLEIRRKTEGALLQHVAYGLAAALAMIFATGIAFIWQIHYGAVSGPLFVALVVSYIFKDRLKDILRSYMTDAFARHLADRRLNVFQHNTSLGTCTEFFDFMTEEQLPPDIRAIRRVTEEDASLGLPQEDILYYRKNILVRPEPDDGRDTKGLMDITRLNLWELSRNMDGPHETFLSLHGDATRRNTGVKAYPIHIVRRQTHGSLHACTASRVLMCASGVLSVDALYPDGPMPPDPELFFITPP